MNEIHTQTRSWSICRPCIDWDGLDVCPSDQVGDDGWVVASKCYRVWDDVMIEIRDITHCTRTWKISLQSTQDISPFFPDAPASRPPCMQGRLLPLVEWDGLGHEMCSMPRRVHFPSCRVNLKFCARDWVVGTPWIANCYRYSHWRCVFVPKHLHIIIVAKDGNGVTLVSRCLPFRALSGLIMQHMAQMAWVLRKSRRCGSLDVNETVCRYGSLISVWNKNNWSPSVLHETLRHALRQRVRVDSL